MKIIKRFINYRQPETVIVEDEEEITDEIEKSLWEIKQKYDFDTEEISTVVEDYKTMKQRPKGQS
tara:strand:- start:307 stop:501 length:195 start_codon:yes stop_codon:yes gene_type:complete